MQYRSFLNCWSLKRADFYIFLSFFFNLFIAIFCILFIRIHPYVFRTAGFLVPPPVALSTPFYNSLPFSHWNIEFVLCFRFEWMCRLTSFWSIPSVRMKKQRKNKRERARNQGMGACTVHDVPLLPLNTAWFKHMIKFASFTGINTPVVYIFKPYLFFAIYIFPDFVPYLLTERSEYLVSNFCFCSLDIKYHYK